VVVSGLARGIDAAAHSAALETGTLAVLAGGVDVIYPPENADLMAEIARRGLCVSEQPMGQEPQARHFPLRNRIISGLVRAVVVVEAASRSGSLITARAALEQGREVLAVPGHPLDARAAGCNALLRDGAVLVRGAEDVLALLADLPGRLPAPPPTESARPPPPAAPPRPAAAPLAAPRAPLQATILDRLGPSPLAEDQLIRELSLPASQIAPELLALEIEGQIERQPGGMLARVV
jgi:DNA processing protein